MFLKEIRLWEFLERTKANYCRPFVFRIEDDKKNKKKKGRPSNYSSVAYLRPNESILESIKIYIIAFSTMV